MSETTLVKSKKEYLQQYVTLHARIKHREKAIQGFQQHLRNGTFPKRMKSLKPYPTMETPETQAVVNEACQQAEKVLMGQRIQEYERKLQEDRTSLQALKETRRQQRQQQKAAPPPKPSMTVTVSQLQQELRDLQYKYTELSQKLKKQEPQES